MKHIHIFVAIFLLMGIFSLEAHVPKGGLGDVTVSPDGKIVAVGGDNRVLYVLDSSSLAVKNRIWIKSNIYEMEFNKDGSVLVVEDSSESLYFISTRDWQTIKTIPKSGLMSAAPAVNLVAGVTPGYVSSTVNFFSMIDGSVKGQVKFSKRIAGIGLNAMGNRMILLAHGPKDTEIKKPVPKDLKGPEADAFKQKNDGKVSIIAEFDVPSGEKIKEKTIFYWSQSPLCLVSDKAIYIFDYNNINARIEGDNIELFRGKSSYNYGLGLSPDRKYVLLGGLREGTYIEMTGLKMTSFNIDQLPGWPEYFKGFGFSGDGTGYAVTTAFRLVKINRAGAVEKVVPIY